MWLLSKNRTQSAKNALCWLRGWVSPDLIMTEFKYLLKYKEDSSTKRNTISEKVFIAEKKNSISSVSDDGLALYKQDFIDTQANTMKSIKFYNVSEIELNYLPERSRDSWTIMFNPEYVKPFVLVSMYFFFYYMAGISSIRPYLLLVINEMKIPVDKNLCAVSTQPNFLKR